MRKIIFLFVLFAGCFSVFAQNNEGQFHGSFQIDAQSYSEDSTIGASKAPEKMLLNSYANFTYTKGNFNAGVRYEGYLNTLQGYMNEGKKNDGIGFPYKYASYTTDGLEITVGNFYEQYGSGMTLRAYEEKLIGYDNALEGVKVRYSPVKGINLKGLVGRQRYYFETKGLVRGIDGEIDINELLPVFREIKTRVTLGGSFVSKYQEDRDPIYNFPENVGAGAGRINIMHGRINVFSEFAYKINDPSTENGLIFKPGNGFLLNASYSQKGLGIFLSLKRIDNMAFRSDRTATLNNLIINNLPVITKNHTYSLMAMYPYATQGTGEIGGQFEIMYKIPKGSALGGKYGTNLSLNLSSVAGLFKNKIADSIEVGQKGTLGYTSEIFYYGSSNGKTILITGDDKYFTDINLEISRKINKLLKIKYYFMYFEYNQGVIEGHEGMVYGNVNVLDVTYHFLPKHAVRAEVQHLFTKQDDGNWAMGLLEYSISPKWFFTVIDQYNYGNEIPENQHHFLMGSIGYIKNATRIMIGYGKQREGIVCVGGVCRAVPASNGFTISITSSF